MRRETTRKDGGEATWRRGEVGRDVKRQEKGQSGCMKQTGEESEEREKMEKRTSTYLMRGGMRKSETEGGRDRGGQPG